MITSALFTIISLLVAVLIITAALSPIETLSWWAGWTEDEIDAEAPEPLVAEDTNDACPLYIVYLSGIASLSGRFLLKREEVFIRNLKVQLPHARVIADVFPYSPSGAPLLESPRVFDRVWRWVQKIKLQGRTTILAALINARNVFQVMVSADHRYGPIFNQGAANVIENALKEAGYRRGGGAAIAIIGYSGGGQIAIGAAPFLSSRLKAPIDVISIGGVMASDPGLHFVRRLHHLYGDSDSIQRVGAVMFPERWKVMVHSEWNTALREERIARHKMGGMAHAGARGYFGLIKNGEQSNNDRTVNEVVAILNCPPPARNPAAA